MKMLAIAVVLAACGQPQPQSPAPPAAPAPPAPAPPPAEHAQPPTSSMPSGCEALVQPSAPGHSSVEPDDMICTHGDLALECPAGFDGEARHCYHAIGGKVARARGDLRAGFAEQRLWCCPGAP